MVKSRLSKHAIVGRAKFLAIHKSRCDGDFKEISGSSRGQRHICQKCGAVALTINPLEDEKFEGWLPVSKPDPTFRSDFPVVHICENKTCHARFRTQPAKKVRCPACGTSQDGVVPIARKGRKPDLSFRDEPTMYYRSSVVGQ